MIYVDMDGVLVDLHKGVAERLSLHADEIRSSWPRGDYSIESGFNMDADTLWSVCQQDAQQFWSNLSPCSHFGALLSALKGHDWCVLSRPTPAPGSWAGKWSWCQRWVPDHDVVLCTAKQHNCSAGDWLIDDSDLEVARWLASGGQAALFPQPWNSAHRLCGSEEQWLQNLETALRTSKPRKESP